MDRVSFFSCGRGAYPILFRSPRHRPLRIVLAAAHFSLSSGSSLRDRALEKRSGDCGLFDRTFNLRVGGGDLSSLSAEIKVLRSKIEEEEEMKKLELNKKEYKSLEKELAEFADDEDEDQVIDIYEAA